MKNSMESFENKKILLPITVDVGLNTCIEENLRKNGFEVYMLTYNNEFKYPGLKYKILNFIHKNFLFDKGYKARIRKELQYKKIEKELESFPKVDYSLTIRADLFNKSILNKVTSLAAKNYAYQWDGLSRFEGIQELIPLFDKFYVFDKNDIEKGKTYPTTNFYFDCFDTLFEKKIPEYDFFYIGSYDNRIQSLLTICDYLYSKNYKLNVILRTVTKDNLQARPYISFIKKPTSYYENLEKGANAKFLIDLKNDSVHEGLSFRIFEALGSNKKIITNNQIVKNYDFYDPQNILCLDEKFDLSRIDDFLNTPYREVDPITKKKYSFTNWIKYLLEIDGNIPLQIP